MRKLLSLSAAAVAVLGFLVVRAAVVGRFEIYEKAFPAGQIALGPDADTANSASMYTVSVH